MNETSRVKTRIVIYLLAVFATLLVCAVFCTAITTTVYPNGLGNVSVSNVVDLSSGWTVNGVSVDFPAQYACKKDETVTAQKVLPSTVNESLTLAFFSVRETLRVTVDGVEIYSYRQTESLFNSIPDDSWHFVKMKADYAGKTLCIEATSGSDVYGCSFQKVALGNTGSLVVKISGENQVKLTLGIFLLLWGFVTYLENVFAKDKQMSDMKFFGVYMMFASLLVLAESRLMQFVIPNPAAISFLAAFALPVGTAFFILSVRSDLSAKPKIANAMLIFTLAATILQAVLMSLGIVAANVGRCVSEIVLASVLACVAATRIKTKPKTAIWTVTNTNTVVAVLLLFSDVALSMTIPSYFGEVFVYGFVPLLCSSRVMYYIRTIRALDDVAKERQQVAEAKAEMLVSQIKPHFLFNALSTVRALFTFSPSDADKALMSLSGYLRANVDSISSNEPVFFGTELKHIKDYLTIETFRFGDRLKVNYDVQDENFMVVPLSVEPFVENAVHHGLFKKPKGGTLVIRTRSTPNANVVYVIDDGVGFDVEETLANDKSKGIKYTKKRLSAMVGTAVEITSALGRGTTVKITFPKNGGGGTESKK